MIVGGGTVSLCVLSLLFLRDDHALCITANVDDVAELTVGVVERVAVTLMTVFGRTLTPKSSLLIVDSAALVEIDFLLFILKLDGDCNT